MPQQAWVILGVITFGVIFIVSVTWILFFYAIANNNRKYREQLKV